MDIFGAVEQIVPTDFFIPMRLRIFAARLP